MLPADTVQPLLVALDMPEAIVLKIQMLRSLAARARPWTTCRPGPKPIRCRRWNTSPRRTRQANEVRRKAAADLASRLLAVAPSRLPIAKVELTRFADRFYRHEATFINPNAVPVWRWEDNRLVAYAATASQAEEFFGLRYARWALELDPSYEPAQVVFLSLATDKAMERGGLEQPLAQIAPDVHDLLATVYVGALINTLDRALAEKRTAVALGITRALGRAVPRSRPPGPSATRPGVLVRALDYPDRRVQLAAADALLRMPGPPVHQATARVVEVLRRAVAADSETSLPATPLRMLVAALRPAAGGPDGRRRAVGRVRGGRRPHRPGTDAAAQRGVRHRRRHHRLRDPVPAAGGHARLAAVRRPRRPAAGADRLPAGRRRARRPTPSNGRLVTVNLPPAATESVNARTRGPAEPADRELSAGVGRPRAAVGRLGEAGTDAADADRAAAVVRR